MDTSGLSITSGQVYSLVFESDADRGHHTSGGDRLRCLLQREIFWISTLNAMSFPGLNGKCDLSSFLKLLDNFMANSFVQLFYVQYVCLVIHSVFSS